MDGTNECWASFLSKIHNESSLVWPDKASIKNMTYNAYRFCPEVITQIFPQNIVLAVS